MLVDHTRPPSGAGLSDLSGEPVRTVPNVVTVARTVAGVGLAVAALLTGSIALIIVGYAAYWVGDMADGWLARRLDQETRRGAVLDILCDRLCTIGLGVAIIVHLSWTRPAVAVFLAQFVCVDTVLSLLFLRWPLLSPNYFYLVDRVLYRWNWSPVAKAVNTSSVILVTVITHSGVAGMIVATIVLVAKIVSLIRGVGLVRSSPSVPGRRVLQLPGVADSASVRPGN